MGSSAWLKCAAAEREEGRTHPASPAAKLSHPGHCLCPFPPPRACRRRKERSACPLRTRERGEVQIQHLSCCPHSPAPRQLCSACCRLLPGRQGCPCRAKGHIWSCAEICLHLQALAGRAGGSPAAGAVPLTLPNPSRLDRAEAGFISLVLAAGLS